MTWTRVAIVLAGLLAFGSAYACKGNDKHPGMLLDGSPMETQGLTAKEIFEFYPQEKIPHDSHVNKVGLKLSSLLTELDGKSGMIHITDCGGRHTVFSSKDLTSQDPEKSHYYLALTRKDTFKLIYATDPNSKGDSVLRRIAEIELFTAKEQ